MQWIVHLKDKIGITIVNAFENIVSQGRKPNKVLVDQGGEFDNNLFKRLLRINNINQHTMKENQLFLKDLLELSKKSFLSA